MAARIGLVGLGTMGAALALNIAEKGFPIAVWNRTTSVTHAFKAEAGPLADRITKVVGQQYQNNDPHHVCSDRDGDDQTDQEQ